jgi:hypothetical protein
MPYLYDDGVYLTGDPIRSNGKIIDISLGDTGKAISIGTDERRGGLINFDTPLDRARNYTRDECIAIMLADPTLKMHFPDGRG